MMEQHEGSGRPPPQNLEAERSVLGAVLLDDRALGEVLQVITEEDFSREAHKKIFEAMKALKMRSAPVDVLTLAEELKTLGALDLAGGMAYLATLDTSVPTAANVAHYARMVADKARRRRLIQAAHAAIADAHSDDLVEEVISRSQQRVMEISLGPRRSQTQPVNEVVKEAFALLEALYERKSDITGVPTGFLDLDKMTSGLQKGELCIVAARPSVGKTSFVLNVAAHVGLRAGLPVVIFTLEMPKAQLILRMLSSEARIDATRMRTGKLSDAEWPRLAQVSSSLAQAPIWLDDSADLTAFDMRVACRRVQARLGPALPLGLIVVDYLQLMRGSGNTDNREQEVAEISRSLKAMAKELQVPVIALSQLSRALEKREDKRPMMSDLRESGSLEQDADLIAFIYREDVYNPESEDKGTAEIIVGKQRNGPIGTVKVAFLSEYTRFENLAREFA